MHMCCKCTVFCVCLCFFTVCDQNSAGNISYRNPIITCLIKQEKKDTKLKAWKLNKKLKSVWRGKGNKNEWEKNNNSKNKVM